MQKPLISLIAAIGKNRELGKDNKLLWNLPEDLKRFKDLTNGHPMIMGRKTLESIGRVLPNRISIVVTKNTRAFLESAKEKGMDVSRLIAVSSIEEGLEIAKNKVAIEAGSHESSIDISEVFVIGGGQIFDQTIDTADKLYLTIVEGKFEADTFFPKYERFSRVVNKLESSYNGISYTFLDLTS